MSILLCCVNFFFRALAKNFCKREHLQKAFPNACKTLRKLDVLIAKKSWIHTAQKMKFTIKDFNSLLFCLVFSENQKASILVLVLFDYLSKVIDQKKKTWTDFGPIFLLIQWFPDFWFPAFLYLVIFLSIAFL